LLPSIIDNLERNGNVPLRLSFILAALLYYYRTSENEIAIKDSNEIVSMMKEAWANTDLSEQQIFQFTDKILRRPIWGIDLNKYPQLIIQTSQQLFSIASRGMLESLKHFDNN
jgi:tagaturonate reductase